jgi:hypothetical protein
MLGAKASLTRTSAVCAEPRWLRGAPCYKSDTVFGGALEERGSRVASWYSSSAVSASHRGSRRHRHTRHTTTPQRWQSPTMSRAHFPMRPLVIRRPGARLNWVSRAASLLLSSCSLQQWRVCFTSWSRYSSRLARNCLHVRERSCRVLRSSCLAS